MLAFLAALFSALLSATPSQPSVEGFDAMVAGDLPRAWECGVTGAGQPRWSVVADATAPTRPNVLKQSGEGTFPWCMAKGSAVANGYVEVKLKPLSGTEDKAGGVVWRFRDSDHYYIARANAVEDNVAVFVVHKGRRKLLKSVDLNVAAGAWHALRVDFKGAHIAVTFDDKRCLEVDDAQLSEAGAVGVWTKGDSITAFDDFSFAPL